MAREKGWPFLREPNESKEEIQNTINAETFLLTTVASTSQLLC